MGKRNENGVNVSSSHTDHGRPCFAGFTWALWAVHMILAILAFNDWDLGDDTDLKWEWHNPVGVYLPKTGLFPFWRSLYYCFFVGNLVHLLYSTALIHYYIRRAEHYIGSKEVAVVYMTGAVFPLLIVLGAGTLGQALGIQFAADMFNYWHRVRYVGSSIAIWATAGFVVRFEKKNFLYWGGFTILIGLGIFMKVAGIRDKGDFTSDLTHIVAFFGMMALGWGFTTNHQIEQKSLPWYTSWRDPHLIFVLVGVIGITTFFVGLQ